MTAYNNSNNTTIPDAPVIAYGNSYIVVECPICGKRHFHGASGLYEHKGAHCDYTKYNISSGYRLVPADVNDPKAIATFAWARRKYGTGV